MRAVPAGGQAGAARYAGVFDWDCLLPMVLKFSEFHITGAEMSRAKQSNLAY